MLKLILNISCVIISFFIQRNSAFSQKCIVRDTTLCVDCTLSGDESIVESIRYLAPSDCALYYTDINKKKKDSILSRYNVKKFPLKECDGVMIASYNAYIIEIGEQKFEQDKLGFRYKVDREFLKKNRLVKLYDKCGKVFIDFENIVVTFYYNDIEIGEKEYSTEPKFGKGSDLELWQISTNIKLEFILNGSRFGEVKFYLGRPQIKKPVIKFE